MQKVKVKIINKSENPNPEYKTKGSAGADIRANENITIHQGQTKVISTGIFVEIPEGYEIQVRPRSGFAKKGVIVTNSPGTIDADYRGEIKVLLHLLDNIKGNFFFDVKEGERIAQLVLKEVPVIEWEEVEELTETERGSGGFGSTGKN